jgi:hypothetical protein
MPELQNLEDHPGLRGGCVLGVCGDGAAGAGRRRPVTQAVTGETLMSPNARSASASIYDRVRDRIFIEWVASGQAARDRATAAAEALKHSGPRTPPATPMPNPPVTAGRGWKVAEHPLRPHREIEAFAKKVWRLGFLNFPWPGYTVKWGDLRGLAACGLCRPDLRLIVICEQYYSIGEYSNAESRIRAESLIRTLVHELCHAIHGGEPDPHGPEFQETLARVMAYMYPPPEPKQIPPPQAAPPRPTEPGRGGGGAMETSRTDERSQPPDNRAALERLERPLLARRAIAQRRERAAAKRLEANASDLYVRASDTALEYMRLFALGRYLSAHPSFDEMVGKQLAVMFPGRVPYEARAAREARLGR